jgi:HKD family nuclease
VNYGDNTHPHWDGVAVEANDSGGYRFLLQGQNNLSEKAYIWTTNSQGVITGGSGWKSGDALLPLEQEFNIDLNGDGIIA